MKTQLARIARSSAWPSRSAPAGRDGGQRRGREGNLPAQELTPRTLYHLLLAEIAGARGRSACRHSSYLDLARSTRDPRIARRATEIAMYLRTWMAAMARGAAEI